MKPYLCLLVVCALLGASGLAVYAAGSQSVLYRISMDAVSGGGGASSSTHYVNVDSSIGQDSPAGPSAGSTRFDNAGVVQHWPVIGNAVADWTCYY